MLLTEYSGLQSCCYVLVMITDGHFTFTRRGEPNALRPIEIGWGSFDENQVFVFLIVLCVVIKRCFIQFHTGDGIQSTAERTR